MDQTVNQIEERATLAALDEAAAEIERGEGVDAHDMMARLRKDFGMLPRAFARRRRRGL